MKHLLWILVLPACARSMAQDPPPRTQVVLLGTGTPNADPDRAGPCTAVVVDGVPYLVDAGPGCVRRAAAAARTKGVAGLQAPRLERVFLTHLHSDHTLGLADLVFTPWVLEREAPLRVVGPKGTKAMVEHLLAAYSEDVRLRLDGLEPANETGHRAEVTEIAPGVVHEDERVRVEAFRVDHGSWKEAFGYRFVTPDRVVVISGDCRPTEALVEAATGADLLVHEVYSLEKWKTRPPVWQRYHAAFHTSTKELAAIAERAKPKRLVLTHQLFWGATPEELVAEIRAHYGGPVVSGSDLDIY
jgi:ribonuclease BN (tRNA processing enzyme)